MLRAVRITILLASLTRAAAAQDTTLLKAGDTVRFSTATVMGPRAEPWWRVALVVRPAADTLVVRAKGRFLVTEAIPFDSVFMLFVSRGREPRGSAPGVYAAGGGLAGLVALAGLSAFGGESATPWRGDRFVDVLGRSFALGALVGYVWGRTRPGPHRWVEVQLPPVRASGAGTGTR